MKKNIFIAVGLLFVFSILFLLSKNRNEIYSYADGSGNEYRIQKNSFEYIPVVQNESSSGVYAGSGAQKKEITDEQFAQVQVLWEQAFQDTVSHMQNREMLSGFVEIESNNKTKSVIVAPQSSSQKSIEDFLDSLVK